MNNPKVVLCDDKGLPIGEYLEKEEAHQGKGRKHLAITVLVYNCKGQVLLQKRKHIRFDGLWDLTGATDIYYLEGGKNETVMEATDRCLAREYNIQDIRLRLLGAFNYFAPDEKFSENEHCSLLIGEYNGEFKLNPDVGYGYKWMNKKDFLKDIKENSGKYSPWAIGSVPFLEKNNFFS